MLKDVRIHLDADENRQQELEKALAEKVMRNLRRNQTAFKVFVPSLTSAIQQGESQNISIFTNQNGELNIVNYNSGRAFYGLSPEAEIASQYESKKNHCTYCDVNNLSEQVNITPAEIAQLSDVPAFASYLRQPPLPEKIEVLVVMGLGIGLHIKMLIEQHDINHLIIYEPEIQYFLASIHAMDWRLVLETAKRKETALYFQLNNNGSSLTDDIQELMEQNDIDGFYVYRHYNHDIFNTLEHSVLTLNWEQLKKQGVSGLQRGSQENILPLWSPPIEQSDLKLISKSERFSQNIAAFKRFVPGIAKEFEHYKPSYWLPVINSFGEVNIISKRTTAAWYSAEPFSDAKIDFENFTQYPNKDGLVLGYNGVKLKHYHHFQFVTKAEKLLQDVEESASALPENIKSLILFGIGPQITHLFAMHQVEKLFICEPNRDLFYASLYSLNWAEILRNIDDNGGRLYINVGDDGSNLFRDLINQFYSVGPYILASTYFYQTYYNEGMVATISQLREQLQVVIAMGENFDHARYGIGHTREAINRRYPLLKSQPASKLSMADKDVPIFIVGNGPSLDSAIEAIREWQERAIIVSCGTALMPLYKNGIIPDFHAEIEQNRSTFDWCSRINDFDFLKRVDLLSCNGIHPDTCELFNNTYIAFKEGESSTVSALNILGRKNYEELRFAFPTVSNFALNLFTLLGFKQLYLFGIDLGFAERDKHHSKQSGYYDEQGKEKYKYSEKNNTTIVVPGNFRTTVFTKYEFKVSKVIIERTLGQVKADCFNTSDGAKIEGTKPLPTDYILLTTSELEKQHALKRVRQQAFYRVAGDYDYVGRFAKQYQTSILEEQLDGFISLAQSAFTATADIEAFTNTLKERLFNSYKDGNSLLFYYLYGTVNHANSVFSKLLYADEKEREKLERLNQLRELWLEALTGIADAILNEQQVFDHVSNFVPERERVFLRMQIQAFDAVSLLSESDTQRLKKLLDKVAGKGHYRLNSTLSASTQTLIVNYNSLQQFNSTNKLQSTCTTIVMLEFPVALSSLLIAQGEAEYTFVYEHPKLDFEREVASYLNGDAIFYHKTYCSTWTAKSWILKEFAQAIIPKVFFVGELKVLSNSLHGYANTLFGYFAEDTQFVIFPNYIMVPRKSAQYNDIIVDKLGNRGCLCHGRPEPEALFFDGISVSAAESQVARYVSEWVD